MDSMFDAPAINSANDYSSQVNEEAGLLSKAGQFIAAMPGAVAADAVNSSGAVVKFFGGDGWETDTHDMIDSLDVFGAGAGDFYSQNKGLVDGAELIASSIIPGTLGIKALRAAQSGKSGTRILNNLGFLDSVSPKALDAARAAAKQKGAAMSSTWDAMNSELGKALVIGVGANVLDAAVFGAAAMVASNASPVYEGLTPLDMAKNWAFDSVVFGGVGSVFSAGKTMYGIRGAAKEADAAAFKGAAIDTGAAVDTAPLRITQTMLSYGNAIRATEGVVDPAVTSAVKSTLNSFGQSLIKQQDDKLAQVAMGKFTQRFAEETSDTVTRPLDVEAANFFTKLTGVRRSGADVTEGVSKPVLGHELPVDITTGSIYSHVGAAPGHLGDFAGARGQLKLGAGTDVKLDLGAGAATKNLKASGFDPESLLNTQAAYWRAASLRTAPEEIAITTENIPMVERMYEEAFVLAAEGKESTAIFTNGGDVVENLAEVSRLLKNAKISAVEELAAANHTPENIAAQLNVSTKFIDNPDSVAMQLRSVTGKMQGMESIKEFLESPRIMLAAYDLSEEVVQGATGTAAKTAFAADTRGVAGVEDVFNASLQGRLYSERLVTKPVIDPTTGAANTALYQQQAHAYVQNVVVAQRELRNLASNSVLPELEAIQLQEDDVLGAIDQASRTLGTQSLIASANNEYGTLGAMFQKIGSNVARAGDAAVKKVTGIMSNSSQQLLNDPKLGEEWILLQNKLSSTAADYVLHPDGSAALLRQDIAINLSRARTASSNGETTYQRAAEMQGVEIIEVSDKLHTEVLVPHTQVNNMRLQNRVLMDNAMMPGSSANHALSEGLSPMYRIPLDTSRYSHFYFVTEKNKLVGSGSTPSMIVAKDAQALQAKKAAIEAEFPNRFDYHTKGNTADYYKALDAYQYSRGLNESYVDSTMRRTGKLADAVPNLSPQAIREAADNLLAFHQRSAVKEVRDATELRFANVFARLDFLGKQFDDAALSKFGTEKGALEQLDSNIKNPYKDAINMAINRGSPRDFPRWMEANAFVERNGDRVFSALNKGWEAISGSKLTGDKLDAAVTRYNQLAVDAGIEPLYTKAAVAQFGDQMATRPVLRKFIAKGQGLLNGMMLGLDPIQAVNNGIGQVMFAAEFRSLVSMIESDAAGAGKLAGLMKVAVPNTPHSINSAIKLHANATRRFLAGGEVWDDVTRSWRTATRDELREEYTKHNLLTSISKQYHQQLDDLTLNAKTLTDAELNNRWSRLMEAGLEKGRKLTGNNLAEEYTRFVAADAARQLTDVAMSIGKIENKQLASVYWNTAVNRIHGVNIASQRAVLFQGVIGQSIGMFMTYQHNLMQQLFRYSATGDAPAMKALAATQFGIYGIQGLPAFNAVATHIVGNASGNTKHTDPYTYIARNANMQLPGNSTAAEWILYGAGSNVLGLVHPDLKMNLYSRGDINPRQLTVFPTDVTQTVAYTSVAKTFGTMLDVAGNIANGAPALQSVLHGIEHNGLNRPLSGLGAVLSGGQTTRGGSLIGSVDSNNTGDFFDKLTVANFVRLAGAKPLDDAAAADSMYRVSAYQAKTRSDLRALASSLRIASAGDTVPTPEQLEQFSMEYAKRGGSIHHFKAFVASAYKQANSNQVVEFAQNTRSPQSQQVQAILGATNDRAWLATQDESGL